MADWFDYGDFWDHAPVLLKPIVWLFVFPFRIVWILVCSIVLPASYFDWATRWVEFKN